MVEQEGVRPFESASFVGCLPRIRSLNSNDNLAAEAAIPLQVADE